MSESLTTVLVIEDDRDTNENLATILEMEGFLVLTACDGRTGLDRAIREKPSLILCDISMPVLDGLGVLSGLRKHPDTASIPFIFLTARGEREDMRQGMNLGADDYLCKPVECEELLTAVRARIKRAQMLRAGPGKTVDFSSATPLESLTLTPREAEVLLWVAQGKANSDIATILGMSEKTVKIHLGHIFEKLGVESRTAAALTALETLYRQPSKPNLNPSNS